jgi:hypothetical protein
VPAGYTHASPLVLVLVAGYVVHCASLALAPVVGSPLTCAPLRGSAGRPIVSVIVDPEAAEEKENAEAYEEVAEKADDALALVDGEDEGVWVFECGCGCG